MKKSIKKYIIIILYIIAGITILYFSPFQNKFGYYFQKSKPWQYDNLIAPFDFPIYKSQKEIKEEEDSLKRKFFPYVEKKGNVSEYVIKKINSITNNFFSKTNNEKVKEFLIDFYDFTSYFIDSLYSKGIINIIDKEKIKSDTVWIISGAFLQKESIDNFITDKKAIIICKNNFRNYINTYAPQPFKNLINKFDFNKLIRPNIFFKEDMTKKELKNLLSTISQTTGMIQKGELIISTGELVSPEKYKVLNSLKKEYEYKTSTKHITEVIFGYFIIIALVLLINFLFIEFEFKDKSFKIHLLSIVLLLIFSLLTLVIIKYKFAVYIIPFALIPIIFRAFYSEYVSIFITIPYAFLISLLVPHPYEYIIYNISVSIVVVFSMRSFISRSHFIKTAIFAFVTYLSIYIAFSLIQGTPIENIKLSEITTFAFNSILLLLSYGLIYVIEKTFGFLSDISLIELSNTNKKLLKELSEKAPGTFQHSIQVSNLAYEIATRIKANALLVKTGAMYHDIGKIQNPEYFTENQFGNYNPHDKIPPEESAKIIINHVTEGVKLAKKHKLPSQIINFITTHHGTSKVEYFLHKYKKVTPNKTPDISIFTYPGPKPFNKETAILMMCDAVEAASRTLDDYSADNISNLVDKIIDTQFKNKQFDNSLLTLQDISTAKTILKTKLQNIYHSRVKYPE